jgi:hypothetical protein
MTLRRALVTAPLAVLVAVLAHVLGFADGHVLGGSNGAGFLSLAFGGTILVAVSAFVWLVASATGRRLGERALLAALPANGRLAGLTATLATGGLAAFATIEAAEGRFPLGSALSPVCILIAAFAVAFVTQVVARWLAAAGDAVASALATDFTSNPRHHEIFAVVPVPVCPEGIRGARFGRAPPPFA